MRAMSLHCIVIGSTVWRSSDRHCVCVLVAQPPHGALRSPGVRGICATDLFLCPLLMSGETHLLSKAALDEFARARSNRDRYFLILPRLYCVAQELSYIIDTA